MRKWALLFEPVTAAKQCCSACLAIVQVREDMCSFAADARVAVEMPFALCRCHT
jgi:hypothetical protein